MKSILEITSAQNPRLKTLMGLVTQKKIRAERQQFVAEGLQQLGMAVAAGWVPEIVILQKNVAHPVLDEVLAKASQVWQVPEFIMEKLSRRDNPPVAIGVFAQRILSLQNIGLNHSSVWLVLEGLRDPGNVGTLIRTADALGAQGVVLLGNCTDIWAPECVRATMGSIFHVPMVAAKADDFLEYVQHKHADAQLVGAHLKGTNDISILSLCRPLFLALGTEQHGLSPELTKACQKLVKIQQYGRAESLNVAVAGGILLHEALRRKLAE